MIFRIFGAIALGVVLSGCSGGVSLNPFNWFGPKTDEELVTLEPRDGFPDGQDSYRGPIQQVTQLAIERASGGYLVRAVGLPPRLGYWEAELVPQNDEEPVNGVMTYDFVVAPPPWATRQSRPQARQITVAHYVSDVQLGSASRIRVVGANNSLTTRR
ncbi:hypothetical protein [Maritimibacter sp. UBA3975]|uniref:hypothetical protein n=1 Tax=Maritimibacter sp. UBA3975 TaxID=1946833 RepID=UPI000C0A60AF|nr:hypothetical protein [Maritimibacter sp. UBA3975]MAM61116.1 hypothetical protein [Maritimibacter sp.]|tara:strand:+ start:12226 stop:12699 length:474 start_codon:yes stop_codon:yes gene_type:complete